MTFTLVCLACVTLPVLIIFVAAYSWVIFTIHAKHTVAMIPRRIETRIDVLSQEMREFIGNSIAQLRMEDFQVAANFHNPDAVKNAQAINVICLNPATNDMAFISTAYTKGMRFLSTSILTTFDKNKRVVTKSVRQIGFLPPDPRLNGIDFPWVRDARALCEAHRRRIELLGQTSAARKYLGPDDLREWLDMFWAEEKHHGVELGYFRADPVAKVYRYTWKGAILMTLKMIPFVARYRTRRRDARSREEWKKLKMDEFQPSAPVVSPEPTAMMEQIKSSLQYLPVLAPGEIRREQASGCLIIRIGGRTVKQVLTRRWHDVVLITFFATLFAGVAPVEYLIWRSVPPGTSFPVAVLWIPVMCLLFALPSVWHLKRELSTCKGSMLISASKEGLYCRNVPKIPDALIPRHDLRGLAITMRKWVIGKKYGHLHVRVYDAPTRRILVPTGDKATLIAIRQELVEAMGMEIPTPPPLPAANLPRT